MLKSMTETAEPLVPSWSIMGLVLMAGVILFVGALVSIARNRTYTSGGTVVWTLIVRPFGTETAARRLTRFSWADIVSLSEEATLAEHRRMGVRMLDRLMQHLPRLAITAQDTNIALREVRVALNMLDLLAYMPRVHEVPRQLLRQVATEVGTYFRACLKARERLPAPKGLLMTMDRARRSLTYEWMGDDASRLHLLHALSGLRLALLPGVEIVDAQAEQEEQPPYGIDGAPL